MRLINIRTLELEEYFGDKIPRYAILSHTWGEEEVSYQDWQNVNQRSAKKGYQKIRACCDVARGFPIDHLWVDTNCINKESSAELTEAINSMFDWYQRSAICLVYLEDFEYHDVDLEGLERCRYWTRGWTLQELLAPDAVDFFDSSWQPFGTKYTLKEEISDITSISVRYLEISDRVHQASVAERMSWAANRRTTRAEDLAYCLMGIFDVNMPLLYGEGEKAFIRLQEEIIKHNDDRTIFCWSHSQRTHPRFLSWKGCLAPHPITFRQGGDFLARPESSVVGTNSEFQLTNSGLRIGLPLLRGVLGGRALAAIEVLEKDHAGNEKLCVCLEQLSENTFVRVHVPKDLLRVPRGWIEATTNVQVYLVHERNPGRKFSSLTRGQLSRYVPGVGKIGGVFSFPTPYAILPIYHPSTSIGVGLPRGEWRGADQNTMEGMIALEKVQGQREDIWYTQMRCNSREKVRCNVHIYVRIPDLPDADWEITAHLQDAEFKLSGTQHMSLPKCVEFAVPKAKVQNEVTNTRVRPLLVSFADKYPKRDFESCEWEWYKGVKLAFDQLTP